MAIHIYNATSSYTIEYGDLKIGHDFWSKKTIALIEINAMEKRRVVMKPN